MLLSMILISSRLRSLKGSGENILLFFRTTPNFELINHGNFSNYLEFYAVPKPLQCLGTVLIMSFF